MVIFYPFFFLYLLRRLRNIGGWYAKQWDNDCNCIIFMRVIESNLLQTSRNLLESVKIFLICAFQRRHIVITKVDFK